MTSWAMSVSLLGPKVTLQSTAQRPAQAHVQKGAPAPGSLATVLLVALLSCSAVPHSSGRESPKRLPLCWSRGSDSLVPAGARSHWVPPQPLMCVWDTSISFSEVLPELVLNHAWIHADHFCGADVSPNLREFTNSNKERISDFSS